MSRQKDCFFPLSFFFSPLLFFSLSHTHLQILDESGSVTGNGGGTDYRPQVRAAVKTFNNGLLNLTQTSSAKITLGVISFNADARLDFPMAEVNKDGAFIGAVNRWVDGGTSPTGTTGYGENVNGVSGQGWTRWQAALELAKDTWPAGNVTLFVFFTDGRPETDNTRAPPNCDNACFTQSDAYFSTLCSGPNGTCVSQPPGLELEVAAAPGNNRPKGAWAAAFFADELKKKHTGAKLFIVGVGNVTTSEDVVQLISGPKRWNLVPETFGASDYLVQEGLDGIGNALAAVLKGVCPSPPNIGAIAGGVIAGVVVAALIAALIIALLSRKAYTMYMARGALDNASVANNPTYDQTEVNAGEMPYSPM